MYGVVGTPIWPLPPAPRGARSPTARLPSPCKRAPNAAAAGSLQPRETPLERLWWEMDASACFYLRVCLFNASGTLERYVDEATIPKLMDRDHERPRLTGPSTRRNIPPVSYVSITIRAETLPKLRPAVGAHRQAPGRPRRRLRYGGIGPARGDRLAIQTYMRGVRQ